jgi:anti-sigma B factor antagonist
MDGTTTDGPTVVLRWERPGVARVSLAGEHDLTTAAEVEGTLRETLGEGCSHLIVDLTDAEFIDSSIINALVHSKRVAASEGKGFSLILGSVPAVERALTVTQVLPYLNRVDTIDDALAELGPTN